MEPKQQTTFWTIGNIFTDIPGIIVTERFVEYHFPVQTDMHMTNPTLAHDQFVRVSKWWLIRRLLLSKPQ